jgi:hypothetical protein
MDDADRNHRHVAGGMGRYLLVGSALGWSSVAARPLRVPCRWGPRKRHPSKFALGRTGVYRPLGRVKSLGSPAEHLHELGSMERQHMLRLSDSLILKMIIRVDCAERCFCAG